MNSLNFKARLLIFIAGALLFFALLAVFVWPLFLIVILTAAAFGFVFVFVNMITSIMVWLIDGDWEWWPIR
jgi:hypothetical protein